MGKKPINKKALAGRNTSLRPARAFFILLTFTHSLRLRRYTVGYKH